MNRERAHKEFMAIYEDVGDAVFRFCLMRVSDREVALDLTQETFARYWQALSGGQPMTNARAFVFTIARRLIIDWYRKKKSVSLDAMTDPDGDEVYEPVDARALANIVEGAEGRMLIESLDKVTAANRDAVYLRYIEDLSPPEIGEILGITANAASVRINRGLAELRKIAGLK